MDHRRFDTLARAFAGALAALVPVVAKGKRNETDRARNRRANNRGRASDRNAAPAPAEPDGVGLLDAAPEGDETGSAPAVAACLANGKPCGNGVARRRKTKGKKGKKSRRTKKNPPCTRCCSHHAVAQRKGAMRCACKPEGKEATNANQCCSGHLSRDGYCGACNPGLIECGGACVHTETDPDNCGACGEVCRANQRCRGGKCVCTARSCPDGCCDGDTCRPGTYDEACGFGGAPCAACANPSPVCAGQVCAACSADAPCPAGQHCYGGECLDCHSGKLQNAVDAAEPGATIRLCPGVFADGNGRATIAKDLTIVGAGDGAGPAASTILRPGSGQAVVVEKDANVTIRKLRVEGASTGNGAGAIRNRWILALEDCTLADNSVGSGFGGAIFNEGALVLTRCTLTGNSAAGNGGGIYHATTPSWFTAPDPHVTITDCTITDNEGNFGGGIAAFGTPVPVLIRNSAVSRNEAYAGGGIASEGIAGAKLTIEGSDIWGNSAIATGGGIYSVRTQVVLDDTGVTGNTADMGIGNGIYNDPEGGGTVTLTGGSTVSGAPYSNCAGGGFIGEGCQE